MAGPTTASGEGVAVRVLTELLARAWAARASDIHIETRARRVRTRFRVDGVMVDDRAFPLDVGLLLLNRTKVLARLDISERRVPQDGMFQEAMEKGPPITLRVSTFPTLHGEKLVMRLLRGGRMIRLPHLGLQPAHDTTLRGLCALHNGLVLVTGPTGAGKTSTLYALLHQLDTRRRNVVTLEDPIEVELQGVCQGQLNRRAGMDFASGLRAVLRQDPDVIMVGEMRDRETTAIAVQASLTGHLVLSTMHTNSVPATITRLTDIGMEAYVIAAALEGLVSQRLVRTLCTECAMPATATDLERDAAELGFRLERREGDRFLVASGCGVCLGTGYRGRSGIFEVVAVDDELRNIIKQGVGTAFMKQFFAVRGVPTLRRSGVELARSGKTSLREVIRMT